MPTPNEHWNAIFSSKADPQLGWYEHDVSQTLKFLDRLPQRDASVVFVAGAGTSCLVDELVSRGHRLLLNDISDTALEKLRERIPDAAVARWMHGDISQPFPDDTPKADLWIDRAVLHFLLAEADIQGYFSNLHATLQPGGYALLAEFSSDGALHCAGLDVHRYSLEEMNHRMGHFYDLIEHEMYTYINPSGTSRPYIYALYRKK